MDRRKELDSVLLKASEFDNQFISILLSGITGELLWNLISYNELESIVPEVINWYKVYDLWAPVVGDERELTYFQISWINSSQKIETHHHKNQNALVLVLGWYGHALVWSEDIYIKPQSVLFFPKWVSHGISSTTNAILELISIQDTAILLEDGSRDFHVDDWTYGLEKKLGNWYLL